MTFNIGTVRGSLPRIYFLNLSSILK